jgi:hypothetical protein
VIENCNDLAYTEFILALHRTLKPWAKQVDFTKSIAFEGLVVFQWRQLLLFSLVILLAVLMLPVLAVAAALATLFSGAAILGFFFSSLWASIHYLVCKRQYHHYSPYNLPQIQIPVASRHLLHTYASKGH